MEDKSKFIKGQIVKLVYSGDKYTFLSYLDDGYSVLIDSDGDYGHWDTGDIEAIPVENKNNPVKSPYFT